MSKYIPKHVYFIHHETCKYSYLNVLPAYSAKQLRERVACYSNLLVKVKRFNVEGDPIFTIGKSTGRPVQSMQLRSCHYKVMWVKNGRRRQAPMIVQQMFNCGLSLEYIHKELCRVMDYDTKTGYHGTLRGKL